MRVYVSRISTANDAEGESVCFKGCQVDHHRMQNCTLVQSSMQR